MSFIQIQGVAHAGAGMQVPVFMVTKIHWHYIYDSCVEGRAYSVLVRAVSFDLNTRHSWQVVWRASRPVQSPATTCSTATELHGLCADSGMKRAMSGLLTSARSERIGH